MNPHELDRRFDDLEQRLDNVIDMLNRMSERMPKGPSGRVAFSVKEAAALLGVSEYSVRRAVREGQLHEVVMNEKRTLIPAWSIDELLARPGANWPPIVRQAADAMAAEYSDGG
jgi:excisionase family DNA binding protein